MHRFLLLSLLLFSARSFASPPCAATIGELRGLVADQSFPLKWYETTMDDGKPLVMSILERDGALVLEFVKSGDGLWAEGASIVCRNGSGLEASIAAEDIHVGPAANIPARFALMSGGQFTFTKMNMDHMRIDASGFSATFCSRP